MVARVPLIATKPLPWGEPKFAPCIVKTVPTGPEGGEMLEILGELRTVKANGLLCVLAVTTTDALEAPTGTGTTMVVSVHNVGIPATLPN